MINLDIDLENKTMSMKETFVRQSLKKMKEYFFYVNN